MSTLAPQVDVPGLWGASDRFLDTVRTGFGAARVTYADLTTVEGTVARRLAVTDGDSNIDLTDAVRRDCTATIIDPTGDLTPRTASDLLAPFATEVTIRSGWRYDDGSEELAPCGVYRVTDLSLTDHGSGTEITISGQDRASVVRVPSAAPVSVAGGSNVVDAIRTLVRARFPSATFAPAASTWVVPALFWPPNTDLWGEARKLASSAGLDLAFGADGSCVIRPASTIGADTPITLVYGPGSYPLWGLKRSQAAADTPNGVLVTGTHSSLPSPVHGEAWVTDPNSPIRRDGPYGERPVYVSSASVSTTDQANAAARSKLAELLGSADTISFSTVPNARADAGDVFSVDRDVIAVVGERFLVTQLTLPWTATGVMQVTGKRRVADVEIGT